MFDLSQRDAIKIIIIGVIRATWKVNRYLLVGICGRHILDHYLEIALETVVMR